MEQVTLRPITTENELECIHLKPREDQLDLVASNADSLIHATKEITSKPYGILAEDQMVGFILFDNEIYNDGYYWILRFMIDEKYQGRVTGNLLFKKWFVCCKREVTASKSGYPMFRITLRQMRCISVSGFKKRESLKTTVISF